MYRALKTKIEMYVTEVRRLVVTPSAKSRLQTITQGMSTKLPISR